LKLNPSEAAWGSRTVVVESGVISRATPSWPITTRNHPLAIRHYFVLSFIGRAVETRDVDDDRLPAFGLTSKSIDTASSLLNLARTPVQIVMNDVTAKALKIDALSHYRHEKQFDLA